MRVLVGGVGYRNLRDYSFGVLVSDALAARAWPRDVSVEDVSYSPIALIQRLEDDPPARRFDLAVLVGAMPRGDRPAGTLTMYRWDRGLPPADRIQSAVGEAVTGVISLDNTLIVTAYFGSLPPLAVVVEIEPEVHAFGDELAAAVAAVFPHACETIAQLALDPAIAANLPEAPLGGGPRLTREPVEGHDGAPRGGAGWREG